MSYQRIDLTNRTFGELKVIELSEKRGINGTWLWKCECTCGNIIHVYSYSLLHNHYKSCGCKQVSRRDAGVKKHIKADTIDGTRKSALKSKLHKHNKSGHKGVSWLPSRKKWRANIGFKGKQISLGYFENMDEAISARKAAEEKYHKPYLEDLEDKENEN